MKARFLNNYKLILVPDWPTAMTSDNWRGWVYEHRYLMEKHLGRSLITNEEVHHLDCDPTNNSLSNLIVLSKEDHAKLHKHLDNPKSIIEKECQYCKCNFNTNRISRKYCSTKCTSLALRRCVRPSKEELVWKLPFTKIGLKYKVSDKTVRKWCVQYGITELPPKGYFLKRVLV